MVWGFFKNKEIERVKEDTRAGFESVKKDVNAVSGWIKHLDSERELQKKEIKDIKSILSSINDELEGLKNVVSMLGELKTGQPFKTNKHLFNKQTPVLSVQTGDQTGVQTPNLDIFSVTERAILWILLNSDMKLSYDDLAAMLGKERSTIRGQMNSIKQKDENIIKESVEKNGKKRVYISEEIKRNMLKKSKVRVSPNKKSKKEENQ